MRHICLYIGVQIFIARAGAGSPEVVQEALADLKKLQRYISAISRFLHVCPEGLKDITDMVGLGGLVSVVCLVSKPNFVSKRLFATIYTIYTSGDVIYEHPLIWPASVSTIHICQFITNSIARIKTCLTRPTNRCCTLLDKFAK